MTPNLDLLLFNLNQYADMVDKLYPDFPGKYSSIQRLVIEKGLAFDRKIESSFIGKQGECYSNCFQMLLRHDKPELYYCEGFANYGQLKVMVAHAWLIDREGNIIDPTWNKPESFIDPIYLGLVLDWDYAKKVAIETKIYGVLDNDLWNHKIKQLGLAAEDLCPLFHQ